MDDVVVAALAGVLQGLLEWIPVSSEGNLALVLALLGEASPGAAVRLSLFLHMGTGFAALAYYRRTVAGLLARVPAWEPHRALEPGNRELTVVGVATVVSAAVGAVAYVALATAVTTMTGGLFVAFVGVLLVGTGVLQRYATDLGLAGERDAGLGDGLLLGAAQGVAILPGVSRSGTTVSALILRGHDGRRAFDLSFVVSIPAAFGAGALAIAHSGGVPAVSPAAAVLSLAVSAVVGYLTIDAILAVVDRVAIWAVCIGLGMVAIAGGILVAA